MKRSEMILKMQRFYGIRHVMVESRHLSLEDFMKEMLDYMESLGMSPPDNNHHNTEYGEWRYWEDENKT